MRKTTSGRKKGMLAIGVTLLIVGCIFLLYGFLFLSGLIDSTIRFLSHIDGLVGQGFGLFALTGVGGIFLLVGIALVYYSRSKKTTTSIPTYATPDTDIIRFALGADDAEDIVESEGLPVTVASAETTTSPAPFDTKDIQIKCRQCGSPENIDSEFCSNCGNKF